MLKPPGGDGKASSSPGSYDPTPCRAHLVAMANELGLRNVSFEVNDLQAAVDWAAGEGYGLVGGIGEWEGVLWMAYSAPKGSSSRWPSESAERIATLASVSAGVRCRYRPGGLPGVSEARFSEDEPARRIEPCRPTLVAEK